MIKWTDIGSLTNIVKDVEARETEYNIPRPDPITYRAKVKIHGTNAGIAFTAGGFTPQSRTSDLTPEKDNAGFASWVDANSRYFEILRAQFKKAIIEYGTVTLYGEWCGPGIQKGTAINQIPRKILAVFALQYGPSGWDPDGDAPTPRLVIEPDVLRDMLPKHPDIHVLPWLPETFVVDFRDMDQVRATAEEMNALVARVEAQDPWVKNTFGIEGIGEGVVMYLQCEGIPSRNLVAQWMFKAKGEAHKVKKTKKAVQVDPEVAASIEEFVVMFVTEARLDQALTEACQGVADKRLTGAFLKWISQDIIKESTVELGAANLTWKQVSQPISKAARNWFMQLAEKI